MNKSKREIATDRIKVFPATKKKLKIMAAKQGITMAVLIDHKFFSVNAPQSVTTPLPR